MADLFANYEHGKFYDEMFAAPGKARPHYRRLYERFSLMESMAELMDRQRTADQTFINRGVTFTVYSDNAGTEKIFPFDLLPRIIPSHEWAHLERGLIQRMQALNLFLADIYGPQRPYVDELSQPSLPEKDEASPEESFPLVLHARRSFRMESILALTGDTTATPSVRMRARHTSTPRTMLENRPVLRLPSSMSHPKARKTARRASCEDIGPPASTSTLGKSST